MIEGVKNRCARCGKRLKRGAVSYRLKAELISRFDGYISGKSGSLQETLDKLGAEIGDMSEKELGKQVYQKFEYIVCPSCRDDLERLLSPEEKS